MMTTRIAEAWLLLTGAAALVLLGASIAGIPWSPWLLVLALPVLWVVFRRPSALHGLESASSRSGARVVSILADVFTVALIGGYTRLAAAAPPFENDYLLIWGVKGKEFFFERGIDWSWLEAPLNHTAHSDYPVLLPLVYDAFALLAGAWPDRWLGLVTAAYGVAALLVVRGALDEEIPRPWPALATAALMPLVFSPYVGLAEAPVIAYGLAGLLFIRRGATLRGAVYLGLAAFTKNEGLTLIIATAIALVAARRSRELPRLWPALAIPLPWLVLRHLHHLQNDLMISGVVDRLLGRLADPWPVFAAMGRHPAGTLLFWAGAAVALLLGWRRLVGEERFFTVAVTVQLAFFIAAYFVSPRELEWHVQWSWERIVRQVMPAVALLAVLVHQDLVARTQERGVAMPP